MITVMPLSITEVDWKNYIEFCQQTINESPTQALDAHRMKVSGISSFLATLARGQDPRQALRNNNKILKHASVGFMTDAPKESILTIAETGVDTATFSNERGCFSILTGTLADWKSALIDLCNQTESYDVRIILNSVCLWMEKAGMFEITGLYSKQTLPDSTFIFKEK